MTMIKIIDSIKIFKMDHYCMICGKIGKNNNVYASDVVWKNDLYNLRI